MRLKDVALADMYERSLQGCARRWVRMLLDNYTGNYCSRRAVDFRTWFELLGGLRLETEVCAALSDRGSTPIR
jgi:hypothetical protein